MAAQTIHFHSDQYQINTDLYQGPLDLLLSLIEKAELDITVLSLAQVTDQFLAYVRQMQEENPAEVSAFVVIASRLIQIKSAALLPKTEAAVADLDEDTGEALAQQLITYRRFKQLADFFSEREDEALRCWLRISAPDIGLEPALDLSGINAENLAELAAHIFAEKPALKSLNTVMKKARLTIREKISLFIQRLQQKGRFSFISLLESGTKVEAVVTFLAMLELIKRNAISIEQDQVFGNIIINRSSQMNEDAEYTSEFGD